MWKNTEKFRSKEDGLTNNVRNQDVPWESFTFVINWFFSVKDFCHSAFFRLKVRSGLGL